MAILESIKNGLASTFVCLVVYLGEDDGRDLEKMEEKIWDPNSSLTEKQIDQFLVVAR